LVVVVVASLDALDRAVDGGAFHAEKVAELGSAVIPRAV
jgi:hypothetical protein